MKKMRSQVQIDRLVYSLAEKYLLSFKQEGVTQEILYKHIEPAAEVLRVSSISQAYRRLLESAQNRNMGSGVIGGAIGGVDNLKGILFGFHPRQVVAKYNDRPDALLDDIVRSIKTNKRIRKGKRGLWPLFCRTIISGARFLQQFKNATDLYKWIDPLCVDYRTRPVLPLLLSNEIDGIGFSLACDFLKEIGYKEFGKPDVHLKDIFKGIGLVNPRAKDYEVFKAIVRVAGNNNVTPYNADKLFWLVGSGDFSEMKIKTNKHEFIQSVNTKLKL